MALASWKKNWATPPNHKSTLFSYDLDRLNRDSIIWIFFVLYQHTVNFFWCGCSISCNRKIFCQSCKQGSNSEKKAQVLLPLIQRSQFLEQAQQRTASLRKATKAGGLWRRRSPLEPQAVPRYCFRRARRATAAVMCAVPTPWSTLRSYRDAPKNHRTVSAVKATEGPELTHLAYSI